MNGSFSWDPVGDATGYNFYFGEDVIEPLDQIDDNLTSPSMAFPEMEQGTVYYRHVVAHTANGDIEGPYWWFKVTYLVNATSPMTADATCRIGCSLVRIGAGQIAESLIWSASAI